MNKKKEAYSSSLNLKTIINNTKFNIFLVNDQLNFVEFNDSFKSEFDFLYRGNLKVGDSAIAAPIPMPICEDWKKFYAIALAGKKLIQDYAFNGEPYIITLNPVFDLDKVIGIAVFSENMKSAMELENSLRDSEFRHHFAMDVSNSGFWDWNMQTNEVYYSDVWKSMLGYGSNEIEHSYQGWEKLVHPDDLQVALDAINKHIGGKTDLYYVEKRLLCKSGDYKWVLAKGKIVEHLNNGKPKRFIGVHIDIDHLKRTEIDLTKKNAQLREIAYITSHGVRKSLTNILGLTRIIDEQSSSLKDNKHYVSKIIESAEELNRETMLLNESIRALNLDIFSFSKAYPHPIKKLMLIDDDEINNMISGKFFSRTGIESIAYTNPLEAIEFLKTNSKDDIELILLDINLPYVNGWECLELMKRIKINIPVIMLTSSIYDSDKETALGFSNVIDFWVKPLTKEKVKLLL